MDIQEASGTSSGLDEAAVNAAAQEEIAQAAPTEQSATAEVPKPVAAGTSKTVQKTDPQKTDTTVQPAFDAQKSFEEVQKQLAETRKWGTQVAQERAELRREVETFRKQQAEMAKKLAEATEQPFNLEQFNQDFVKNGFKAFDPYFEKKLSAVKEAYESRLNETHSKAERLEVELNLMGRRSDSKNYPNFADLEKKMVEIYNSPNCPIDKSLPVDQKIDALYNFARSTNSEEAIKVAEKAAYGKAQAELAKEARSAVATGGKGVSSVPADLYKMPLDKLEQLAIQMHGIADRD